MKKATGRIHRIEDVVRNALAEILQREAENLQYGILTVTGVVVSQDLSFAKIYISVLDDAKHNETIKILNEAAKYLRYELAHSVKLRVTPELRFYYDDSTMRGNRISSLINDALKDKKSQNDE